MESPGICPRSTGLLVLQSLPLRLKLLLAASSKRLPTISSHRALLLRMKEGVPVTIEVNNQSSDPEIVHWHGLFLLPEIDGAMEEGTPHIAAGMTKRYSFTPRTRGVSLVLHTCLSRK